MENKHIFILQNINNGAVVEHSLVFIKGMIDNCGINCDLLLDQLHCCIRYPNCEKEFTIKCKSNSFRVIIKLHKGDNHFRINCSCSTAEITIKYKPLEVTYYTILPLYIVCNESDGKFQSPSSENNSVKSACRRILLGCEILQLIIADLLERSGYKRKTFVLNSEGCLVFNSKLNYKTARHLNQTQLWNYFAQEIINSPLGNCNTKYIAFLSCTYYNPYKFLINGDMFKSTEGYVAYGGGGLALLGTACLYTWPEKVSEILSRFEDSTEINKSQFMDDSCFRGTWSGCFSTTLGSALHELCHTLDLGHTEEGIMGHGFNNIQDYFLKESNYIKNKELEKFTIKEKKDFFLTKNCTAILNYHKWLQNPQSVNCSLKIDPNVLVLKSLAGIRVVEARTIQNELVKKYWIFDKKVRKYQFQIPFDCCKELSEMLIFSIDDVGNILKQVHQTKR